MYCLKEIYTGDSFGELALLNYEPRRATIKCHTDCHFAILQRAEFNKILKEVEE